MQVVRLAASTSVITPTRLTYSPDTAVFIGDAYQLAVNTSITNQGMIWDTGDWTLALRYSTFANYGCVMVRGSMTVSGTNQYGAPGVVNNYGMIWVQGGTATLQQVSGMGDLWVTGAGTLHLTDQVGAGEAITLTAGMLDFARPDGVPGGRNPAMQFMGTVGGLSERSHIQVDGVWDGFGLRAELANIRPGFADLAVFDGAKQILGLHLAGHYDAAEFEVRGVFGSGDVVIDFRPHALGGSPHS